MPDSRGPQHSPQRVLEHIWGPVLPDTVHLRLITIPYNITWETERSTPGNPFGLCRQAARGNRPIVWS